MSNILNRAFSLDLRLLIKSASRVFAGRIYEKWRKEKKKMFSIAPTLLSRQPARHVLYFPFSSFFSFFHFPSSLLPSRFSLRLSFSFFLSLSLSLSLPASSSFSCPIFPRSAHLRLTIVPFRYPAPLSSPPLLTRHSLVDRLNYRPSVL